jgi:hypothetical protein
MAGEGSDLGDGEAGDIDRGAQLLSGHAGVVLDERFTHSDVRIADTLETAERRLNGAHGVDGVHSRDRESCEHPPTIAIPWRG